MGFRVDGRIEKRVRLAVPLELLGMRDPASAESTHTENICSFGVRIISGRPREVNEELRVTSPLGRLKMKARVIYCQALRDGAFAIGLQFERVAANFTLAARGTVGSH